MFLVLMAFVHPTLVMTQTKEMPGNAGLPAEGNISGINVAERIASDIVGSKAPLPTYLGCNGAVQLDGVNEYLHTPFHNYTFEYFTLECWLNAADYLKNVHFISLHQGSDIILGNWSGGDFSLWTSGLTPIESTVPHSLNTNEWHHIAYVFDGSNQIVYIDGNEAVRVPTTGTPITNSATFNAGLVIGARYSTTLQFTNSAFADVRIWNVARTQEEIKEAMTVDLDGSEEGLLAYYTFDEGPGIDTVADLTGNGNTLTLYNMELWDDRIDADMVSRDVVEVCEAYTWINGTTYTDSDSTSNYTMSAANGCDSLVFLDLTIHKGVSTTDIIEACDSFTWSDGVTYFESNNTAVKNLTTIFGCDSLVTLNLTVNHSSSTEDSIVACNSYTWIDGNTYTSSNKEATMTYSSMMGCDSVITLNLTINSVSDITTSTSGQTITVNNTNASYQWLDCGDGNTVLDGETAASFTVSETGSFAVELTENGCVDTSDCVVISALALDENSAAGVWVYPNPNEGQFSLNMDGAVPKAITIHDLNGKLVTSVELQQEPSQSFDLNLAPGMYLMRIQTGSVTKEIKLLIK